MTESVKIMVYKKMEGIGGDFLAQDYLNEMLCKIPFAAITGNSRFASFGDRDFIKVYNDFDNLIEVSKKFGCVIDRVVLVGYTQSDWNFLFFPKGALSKEDINYIEMLYMGKYVSYIDEDNCIVLVPDEIEYRGIEKIKEYIAHITGEDVIKIKTKISEHTIYEYEIK